MADVAWWGPNRHIHRPRGRFAVLFSALLFTLAACGGGTVPTPTPATSPAGTPTAGDTDAPIEPTPTPTPTTTPPPDDNIGAKALAWVLGLGPSAGSGPDAVVAYRSIQKASQASCREALDSQLPDDTQRLYHGAAAACLAALYGRSARWAEAEAAYDALPGRPEGCLDRATFDLLESIVNAHRADPTATFRKSRSSHVELPCPTIDNLKVTRDTSGEIEILVRGNRLRQVKAVTYSFVDSCPAPDGLEPELSAEVVTSDRTSLRATGPADDEFAAATSILVAIIAVPEPWVADADCVAITTGE